MQQVGRYLRSFAKALAASRNGSASRAVAASASKIHFQRYQLLSQIAEVAPVKADDVHILQRHQPDATIVATQDF